VPGLKTTNKISLFRNAGLFRGLTREVVTRAADLAISSHLNPGQILFYEHERASGLYVVSRGELRSIRQDAEGREQTLATASRGAVLGLAALFSGETFFSTMVADSTVEVFCIEKHDFHQLCREDTGLLRNAVQMLAEQIREFAEIIESLALRSVEQRVAEHLALVADGRGTRSGKTCLVELRLTRTGIASRIGSAREVVSRAFTHLEERGLIHVTSRRLLTIPDMPALSEFAGIASRSDGLAL
jgi:CRP/FNR family transcriptional regulator, cyclic AMP receptor protein